MAAAVFMAVACDDSMMGGGSNNGKDDNDPDSPGNVDDTTPLTPEENRAKLEQIGLDAINMATPDKQADLLKVIDKFYEYTNEYYLDFRGDFEDSGSSYRRINPIQPVDALMKAARAFANTGNPYVLSKSVIEDSYIYEASRVYGIYEFAGDGWEYTASDSELTFVFPCEGKEITATVSGSGKEYSYSFEDEYYNRYNGYYDENGNWVGDSDHYIDYITITVPARIEASITSDSESLLSLEVEGEYNEGSRVEQTLSLVAGSYDVDMSLEITNSRISQNFTFDIDGTRFLSTEVSASGTGLCSADSYENNIEDMFSDANVKVSVLDLNVVAESNGNISSFISDYTDMENNAYDWEDDPSKWESDSDLPPTWASEDYITDLCDLINSNFTVTASYGSRDPFADFAAKPMYANDLDFYDSYYDEDYGHNTGSLHEFSGYETSFIIKFRDDGAEYEIVDFFNEDDYASVVDAAESLAERYEYYLNYMFNY